MDRLDLPSTLRMVERGIVVLGGILSIYLGYRLFALGITEAQGSARAFGVELLDFGPGLFFAALGAYVLVRALGASIRTGGDPGADASVAEASHSHTGASSQPAAPAATFFFGVEDPTRHLGKWSAKSFFLETRDLLRALEGGGDAGAAYRQLNPHNSANLTDEQFRHLWNGARDVQSIAFENTLSFLLAHEVGHVVLDHEREVERLFPSAAMRRGDHATWILWRRRSELAADRLAARLSLGAAYQPAQVLPWLDLVEVRRSFYGTSAEYPTPGQRASTIWAVYAERFGGDGIDTSGLSRVDPLPPDRDMSKSGRARNLANVRQVREFRRGFLAELDAQVDQVLSETGDPGQGAVWFLWRIKAYRGLLRGAEDLGAVDDALSLLEQAGAAVPSDAAAGRLLSFLQRAFRSPETVELLSAHVGADGIRSDELRVLLTWGRTGSPMFADALETGYLLANTRFRWEPEVFEAMLRQLPEPERERLGLVPYRLGVPQRPRRYTIHERVRGLERWNGSYAEAYQEPRLGR